MTTAVISNYLETKLIDHILRNTAYTTPGLQVWVALYTSDPTDADTGTEVTGTNYARKQVTAWDAVSNRATQNTNVITFDTAGAGGWTGPITHVGIRDASSGGNLLFFGQLPTPKTISAGDTFSIAAGDLDVSLGGAISNYLAGKIFDHVLRNTAYTTPGTSIYAALYTSDPTAADAGSEPVINTYAYARKQITGWDATAGGNGLTQNTAQQAFAAANGGNWGTITHVGIRDAATAGNLLFFGGLDASKIVNDGDTFQFNAGQLKVSLS